MGGAPAQSAVPEDGDDQILVISEDEEDDRPKPHNFESFGTAHVNDAG
jgi:hypothetical protein